MQQSTFRSVIALGLLLIGLAFVYLPEYFEQAYRESASQAAFTYVADFDYWQRTPREQLVTATSAFDLEHNLNEVPLSVGEWEGKDIPQTNIGVFMVLEPEPYVERLYRNKKGQYLWLTMIGGRSSRTFHPAEDCYASYGWQTELSSQLIPLQEGGEIYGLFVEARKEEEEQLSFYFYLFPNRTRKPTDGIVIFKVTSPRYESTKKTLALQSEFVRHFFKEAKGTGAF